MIRQMQVEELRRRLDAGEPTYLVDVRQPWEHELARLPDDLLIPLNELPARLGELDDSVFIVCYCHHGIRSLTAASFLERNGCARVLSLAGGIDAWSRTIDPAIPRY